MKHTVCLLCRRPKQADWRADCDRCLLYMGWLQHGGLYAYAQHLRHLAYSRLDAMEARW